MPPSQTHFCDGKPPAGAAQVNLAYSTILPNSNSPFSRCMSAFIRALLDIEYNHKKKPSDSWMLSPSAHNFHVGSNLPDSILMRPIDPIPINPALPTSQKISPAFRILFLQDLSESNFTGVTFAWSHPWDSHWNQLFAKFVLKHWRNAYTSGAFTHFFMDPVQASNTSLQLGILHRWFMGRQKGIRLGHFSHAFKSKKSKSESRSKVRMQISQHRQETLSTLPFNSNIKALFDNIKATSDTEINPPRNLVKIPLRWRSTEFGTFSQELDNIFIQKKTCTKGRQFVHDYILEARRKTLAVSSRDSFKDVPRNLPLNCYAPEYLSTLSESQKILLNPQDPINMSELLTVG
ncbi:hypothetical protein PTTG_29600 [Puccinia triticina 1-1 BBBD Race 1]|uniref:Uncharacterized protein n=1 Tax=Puccinia triticina (isolate 1-1 / race 1 (BBBD)) TaxID=630390 RepID=A0A180G372_PUCT1|nr:hypothetical protein PTTG_29600 [Puccinia triticina 1-1 BBBD Race 1]